MANFKSDAVLRREGVVTVVSTPFVSAVTTDQNEWPTYSDNISYFWILHTQNGLEATNDTVELLRLPVQARVLEVWRKNVALGTTININIGIALPVGPLGTTATLVGANSTIATTLSQAQNTNFTRVGSIAAASWGKMLWEVGGLGADPSLTPGGARDYSLLATYTSVTTPTAAANSLYGFVVELP